MQLPGGPRVAELVALRRHRPRDHVAVGPLGQPREERGLVAEGPLEAIRAQLQLVPRGQRGELDDRIREEGRGGGDPQGGGGERRVRGVPHSHGVDRGPTPPEHREVNPGQELHLELHPGGSRRPIRLARRPLERRLHVLCEGTLGGRAGLQGRWSGHLDHRAGVHLEAREVHLEGGESLLDDPLIDPLHPAGREQEPPGLTKPLPLDVGAARGARTLHQLRRRVEPPRRRVARLEVGHEGRELGLDLRGEPGLEQLGVARAREVSARRGRRWDAGLEGDLDRVPEHLEEPQDPLPLRGGRVTLRRGLTGES